MPTIASYLPTRLDLETYRGDDLTVPLTFMENSRTVNDAVTVGGGVNVTSLRAQFANADVGRVVAGDNVPFGAVVASYVSPEEITISIAATEDGFGGRLQIGDALDVSTWEINAQVRKSLSASATLADFVVDATQAANGQVVISISTDKTTQFPVGEFAWDFQRSIGGKPRTLLGGSFSVTADVTR